MRRGEDISDKAITKYSFSRPEAGETNIMTVFMGFFSSSGE